MKNLSFLPKVYILGTILFGFILTVWIAPKLNWSHIGLYLLAALGAVTQTLKVEGPNDKTNYSIAWFVYGFAFVLFGPVSAIFIIVISHLAEWIWHKYLWYIQSFNIGAHGIPVLLAGWVFAKLGGETQVPGLGNALALSIASLVFVFVNHLLVGLVVKFARGQSLGQSGVFEFLTLFLDFTVFSMGAVTALVWQAGSFAAILNILPLYLLYNALRVPSLSRQLQEVRAIGSKMEVNVGGD